MGTALAIAALLWLLMGARGVAPQGAAGAPDPGGGGAEPGQDETKGRAGILPALASLGGAGLAAIIKATTGGAGAAGAASASGAVGSGGATAAGAGAGVAGGLAGVVGIGANGAPIFLASAVGAVGIPALVFAIALTIKMVNTAMSTQRLYWQNLYYNGFPNAGWLQRQEEALVCEALNSLGDRAWRRSAGLAPLGYGLELNDDAVVTHLSPGPVYGLGGGPRTAYSCAEVVPDDALTRYGVNVADETGARVNYLGARRIITPNPLLGLSPALWTALNAQARASVLIRAYGSEIVTNQFIARAPGAPQPNFGANYDPTSFTTMDAIPAPSGAVIPPELRAAAVGFLFTDMPAVAKQLQLLGHFHALRQCAAFPGITPGQLWSWSNIEAIDSPTGAAFFAPNFYFHKGIWRLQDAAPAGMDWLVLQVGSYPTEQGDLGLIASGTVNLRWEAD